MDAAVNKPIANALLYSDGALHLVGARHNEEKSSLFPAFPDGGAADDHFHPPQLGGRGRFLLRVARKYGGSGWISAQRRHCQHVYRRVPLCDCNGDERQECHKWASIHGAMLPVNRWEDNNHCGFANYNLALVATVAIRET
ncbi:putative trans-sialidase, partial [Trypanosoma cruzi]